MGRSPSVGSPHSLGVSYFVGVNPTLCVSSSELAFGCKYLGTSLWVLVLLWVQVIGN